MAISFGFKNKSSVSVGSSIFANLIKAKRESIVMYNTLGKELPEFNLDADDYNEWYIAKDESYTPDKEAFIVKAFRETFKNIVLSDDDTKAYEVIGQLASRSSKVNEWLAINNAKYALEAQLPTYFKDLIKPEKFKDLQSNVTKYNKEVAKSQALKDAAASEYKQKLNKIDQDFEEKVKNYAKDKFFVVLNLPATKLPLTIQTSIVAYAPASEDAITQRSFAREMLIRYKLYLLGILNDDPSVDIISLIDENTAK